MPEHHHPFNSARYDFPIATAATRFVFICSTPRSGSNLLATRLWATGQCGAPHEYFNPFSVMPQLLERFGVDEMDDYLARLYATRTGPNGVFAAKLHFRHYRFMADEGVLARFSPVRWVYLVRRDLAAQAVSLAYARQTGQWTSLHARSGKVAYDRSRIDRCLQELQRQNAGWDAVFAQAGMRPLRVEFEALIAEQDAVVAQVAAWLGIDATVPSLVQVPATEPQAEPEKAEWLARYRAETAAA